MDHNVVSSKEVIASTALALAQKKKKKLNAQSKVYFWSTECKYSVIIDRVKEIGWKLIDDEKLESKVNVFWIDVATIHERFRSIQPWQIMNHFPGMPNIARKNRMGQNLNRMQKLFPKEYSFYPRTWILPGELNDFRNQFDNLGNSIGNKIFIIKPDAGCQGRGIFLTKTYDNVPFTESVVAQMYIKRPLLLDGYKFDLRIYCLVSSVKPLRIFLFHDGLVRMCTEEYVKPTKQNLSNTCMHLTNYAVNKHNENFLQSQAKNSEDIEGQDEGFKRSLLWFMDYVRKEHGHSKANWLWKRIGILCTRTILAIMPTLSREYDQHFKSFDKIPIDPNDIKRVDGTTTTNATTTNAINHVPSTDRNNVTKRNRTRSGSNTKDDRYGEDADGNGEEEEEEEGEGEEEDGEEKLNGSAAESKKDVDGEKAPKYRGSRCFEVLGFDIMIDSGLKPWLIEVNHLPSFGTDSALDLDIKQRLMEQVFTVLPAMADDHQQYLAYHKAESEKRLQQANRLKQQQAANERDGKVNASNPLNKKKDGPVGGIFNQNVPKKDISNGESSLPSINKEVTESKEQSESNTDHESSTEAAEQKQMPLASEGDDYEIFDEECTPERLVEIRSILVTIYEKHSPDKISKIDRLLAKYSGHEEEFLRFVYGKYSVTPPPRLRPSTPQMTAVTDPNTLNPTKPVLSKENSSNRIVPKRFARSLSPPRSGNTFIPTRRPQPAWKSTPDEDIQYRQEVLSLHFPDDSDEWLQYEMKRLTQFTRIFPTENRKEFMGGPGAPVDLNEDGSLIEGNEEDPQHDEDDDEVNNTPEAQEILGINTTSGSKGQNNPVSVPNNNSQKTASYEEILYQVFLQDKRQTMRLKCPLPSKAFTDNNSVSSSLPPLESRPTFGSNNTSTGKGIVGWKSPAPKPIANKQPPRQPTQNQLEAAKRLSQGLSVASTSSNRSRNSFAGSTPSSSVGLLNIVLDPHEHQHQQQYHQYNQYSQGDQNTMNQYIYNNTDANGFYHNTSMIYQPQGYQVSNTNLNVIQNSSGIYYSNSENSWPSTKASRLLEESRLNRIKLENAKIGNAPVLRQQIFNFETNNPNFYGNGTLQPSVSTIGIGGITINAMNNPGGNNIYNANANKSNDSNESNTGTISTSNSHSSKNLNPQGGQNFIQGNNNNNNNNNNGVPSNGTSINPKNTVSVGNGKGQTVLVGAGAALQTFGNLGSRKSDSSATSSYTTQSQVSSTTQLTTAKLGVGGLNGNKYSNTNLTAPPSNPSQPSTNVLPNGSVGNAPGDNQEAMLRQLFPSWF